MSQKLLDPVILFLNLVMFLTKLAFLAVLLFCFYYIFCAVLLGGGIKLMIGRWIVKCYRNFLLMGLGSSGPKNNCTFM